MILKGEHLFVTGGAAGIGEAIVIGGAKEGAKVSFVDIDDARSVLPASAFNQPFVKSVSM